MRGGTRNEVCEVYNAELCENEKGYFIDAKID